MNLLKRRRGRYVLLVLGVFWKRANHIGAIAGIAAGFAVCLYYMFRASPTLGGSVDAAWLGVMPMAAGVFGVPAGLLTIVAVSLLTPAPSRNSAGMVDYIRTPE